MNNRSVCRDWRSDIPRICAVHSGCQKLHIPEWITCEGLPTEIYNSLLSLRQGKIAGRYIATAISFLNTNPIFALSYASEAARIAYRLPAVRFILAKAAFACCNLTLALRNFRAARRLSGGLEPVPWIIRCLSKMNRSDEAVAVGNDVYALPAKPSVRQEIALAMAEARIKQGRPDLALLELQQVQFRVPYRDEALRLMHRLGALQESHNV